MTRNLRFKDDAAFKEFLRRTGQDTKSKGRLQREAHFISTPKQTSPAREPQPVHKNKFHAQKITHGGIEFDSRHEGERYLLLRSLWKAGEIWDLKCHVPLRCEVNGFEICTLLVDFIYSTHGTEPQSGDRQIFEDAKGYKRGAAYQLFKLKKKLAEACHGISIDEV